MELYLEVTGEFYQGHVHDVKLLKSERDFLTSNTENTGQGITLSAREGKKGGGDCRKNYTIGENIK